MAFDLDEDELRATRKMNKADRDEIEVNEYVRTKDGHIAKYIEKLAKDEDVLDEMLFDNFIYEKYKHIRYSLLKEIIVKHSKQLIDLVELKDLVCFKNKLPNSLENEKMIIHIFDNDTLEEVKQAIEREEIELLEILTHEQFEQNSYKVGGEDE